MENESEKVTAPTHKLCANCAYREHCKKRFSVNTVNGQVQCQDHAFDLNLVREIKKSE